MTVLVIGNDPSSVMAETPQSPPNFAEVHPQIYRSSFPKPEHFEYLKGLGLKTILTLVGDDYPEEHVSFMKSNKIRHVHLSMPGNKSAVRVIPATDLFAALSVVIDRRNHPMLIHCNKGKHRTGCVVACLRKLQERDMAEILVEYRRYASPKARLADEEYIENFDVSVLRWTAYHNNLTPIPRSVFFRPPHMEERAFTNRSRALRTAVRVGRQSGAYL